MHPIVPAERRLPSPDQIIFNLIRTFPCLSLKTQRFVVRAEKFDPDEFYDYFASASSGELHCALFVLNVWNHGYAESKGWHFDLIKFVGCVDSANRAALLAWAAKPTWP